MAQGCGDGDGKRLWQHLWLQQSLEVIKLVPFFFLSSKNQPGNSWHCWSISGGTQDGLGRVRVSGDIFYPPGNGSSPGSPSSPISAPRQAASHPWHFQLLPRLQWSSKPLGWSESRWFVGTGSNKWLFNPRAALSSSLELPPCPFISPVSAHRAQVCCLAVGGLGKQCSVNITFYCLGMEQWLNSRSGVEGRIQREDSQPSVCALGWVFATQKSAQLQSFLSSFPCFAPWIYIGVSSLMHSLI